METKTLGEGGKVTETINIPIGSPAIRFQFKSSHWFLGGTRNPPGVPDGLVDRVFVVAKASSGIKIVMMIDTLEVVEVGTGVPSDADWDKE